MSYSRVFLITVFLNLCVYLVVGLDGEDPQCSKQKLRVLSKSDMCRCFHRPNFDTANVTDLPSELQKAYTIQQVDFDPDYKGHADYVNAICVYFGHSDTAPANLTTYEFVMEALNEHGWPVGVMKVAPFRDICKAPSDIRRKHLGETVYHSNHKCFKEAGGADYADKLYTETVLRTPFMLQFHNTLKRPKVGVLGLLIFDRAYPDPTNRPTKIRFLSEVYFSFDNPSAPLYDKTARVLSETFDVSYTSGNKLEGVKPSSSPRSIEPSLDYSLQVRDNNPPGSGINCIRRPPSPLTIPVFDEIMCVCFADPRYQETIIFTNGTEIVRDTLNVKLKVDPISGNGSNVPAKDILDFYSAENKNDFVVEYDHAEKVLVAIYPFMAVYKDRSWRQREMVMMALADNGVPIGRWIDPYESSEKTKYERICDKIFETRKLNWTMPPFPAVQKCVPYDKTIVKYPYEATDSACYFHFHSDYFFKECVEKCKEAKYICAVWTFDSVKLPQPPTRAFEFQFILHAVYNKNERTNITSQEWIWMETAPENEAFFKRSDVWKYTGNSTKWFKRVDHTNEDSETILSADYSNKKVMNGENKCIEPATYFMQIKDNNLCVCTFHEENVGTWQSHYGTSHSLVDKTKPISDHFRLEIYKKDKDWMVIRVSANPKSIVQTHYILHAVYLQAWDQYGIPIGRFEPGYYGDSNSSVTKGGPCPKDLFPPQNDPISQVFKLFSIATCPRHSGIPEFQPYMIPDANYEPEVFVYQNIWREQRHSEVCAKFLFNVGIRQMYATSIQILAFLRVEDRHPGLYGRPSGNAYMVELRSELQDASDLRLSFPPSTAKHQDVVNKLLPLNYNYFRSTLTATETHYQRHCLPPAHEPERFFDLCRYYVTTPPLDPQYKHDIDFALDEYTKTCGLWLDATAKFTPSHFTRMYLQEKIDRMKPEVMILKEIKSCFSLKAYKHKLKNSLHVSFRVLTKSGSKSKPNETGDGDACEYFKKNYLREVAIVALNEEGYPIGRSWFRGMGSFQLYNEYVESTANNSKLHCQNEDIKLTKEDFEEFGSKMVQDEDKARCSFGKPLTYYKPNITKYHQDAVNLTARPSLFIWSNYRKTLSGFCAHWFFPTIHSTAVTPPKFVQFIASVQILRKGGQIQTDPFHKADRIFTIRSPKYKFEYNKEQSSPNCHGTEADIDSTEKPDVDCDCEAGIKPPACTKLYEHYNHILDSRLYRACYEEIDATLGHEIFELHDCRTKIDYVREPDVFPTNKTILAPDQPNPPENQRMLDKTFDPTEGVFDGCGLIKQCFSKFKEVNIDKEKACIKNRSCDVLVTFGKGLGESVRDDEVVIELYAKTKGWVAVGISEDKKMGKDYVVECVHEDGNVSLYNSWNIKSYQSAKLSNNNIRMKGKQSYIHNVRPIKAIYYEERIYCKFYMKIKFSKVDPDLEETHHYKLDQQLIYILAYSNKVSKWTGEEYGNINTHFDVLGGGESEVGGKEVVATKFFSPKPEKVRLFRLHTSFMLIGWMFFTSISIFVARYFKDILVRVKILNVECWYFFHVVTCGLGVLTMLIAFIVEYFASQGWTNMFTKKFHSSTGLSCLVVFVVEIVLGGLIKKGKDEKFETNMLHRFLGHFVYNFAMLNIAFSYRMVYATLSCDFGVYVIIWIFLYYLLHIFMSYHNKWVSFIMGQNTTAPTDIKSLLLQDFSAENKVAPSNSKTVHKSGDEESQSAKKTEYRPGGATSGRYIRLTALGMYVLVNLAYTLAAVRKAHTYSKICFGFDQVA